MKTFRKNSTVLDQPYIYQCGLNFRFDIESLPPSPLQKVYMDMDLDLSPIVLLIANSSRTQWGVLL